MTHVPTAIRPLRTEHVPAAAHALARAFQDDPMMRHVIPDDTARPDALRAMMGFFLRSCLTTGRVLTTEEGVGAAGFIGPGRTGFSTWQSVRSGFLGMAVRLGPVATHRLLSVERVSDRLRHDTAGPTHLYLAILGVDPDRHGTGLGGRLLQATLQCADDRDVDTHLETMHPKNVPFYERHGFEVVGHDNGFGGAMEIWSMRRPRLSVR